MRKPRKTAKHIFAEMLCGENVGKDRRHIEKVLAVAVTEKSGWPVKWKRRTRRVREVAAYLEAAAKNQLGPKGGYGSLKHVLYLIRDYAPDEVYEAAVKEVLNAAVLGDWPIATGAFRSCQYLPLSGGLLQGVDKIDTRSEALNGIESIKKGEYKVAVSTAARNVTKAVMEAGYDCLVAKSEIGSVVKVRRGLRVDAKKLPGAFWRQAYPDLAVWTGDVEAAPEPNDVLSVLTKAIRSYRQ